MSQAEVFRAFAIEGELLGAEPLKRGHIHDTFVSTWRQAAGERHYLHQRINDAVFPDVELLMRNVRTITEHLAAKRAQLEAGGAGDAGDEPDLEPLVLVPTRAGKSYLRHASGPWRTYEFLEHAVSHDRCSGPEQAFAAARAFGRFLVQLADLPPEALGQTLPDFFSSPARYRQLEAALVEADPARARNARREIGFVQERADQVFVIERLLADGTIAPRVVHGDTKLNNILFDTRPGRTGTPRAVVDLDTAMPGYVLYDFGDLVRFTAATCAEDERDLALAGTDLELYRALAEGFLASARELLGPRELELMPFAARLVTLTIGMRFLGDHLAGDRYFKVSRPNQNLDRARVQLAMVDFMERHEDAMRVG